MRRASATEEPGSPGAEIVVDDDLGRSGSPAMRSATSPRLPRLRYDGAGTV
ncbi:hypothetical protein IQ251_10810 [Saccharopolyspora sp. HNM0983]|uniref:Uncharacterized protein n=1 Tax=Saccharopolyspora montiporae TaxID=2781240 RepID=A0A929G1Q9_9PSEU|nr:hypothetical protein [Saccharopolyspora sp. HNM0983]MBE9374933.1 hypothetical protein [Saccharopolyspora sp. HNM0983]